MDSNLLTITAQRSLIHSLNQFGNQISIPHRKALYALLATFTSIAAGQLQGRWAFPIATGAGKTRAIIEWATAVSTLKAPYSMVVSASRIEALCQLKRDMVENGIPAEQIGLIYTPVYEKDAKGKPTKKLAYSEPFTENNEARPFLLCSHQLIRSRESNLDLYNVYNGAPRSVVVYDESLLVSDIEHFTVDSLCQSIFGWIGKFQYAVDSKAHASILNWLTAYRARIDEAYKQYDQGQVNELPPPCVALSLEEACTYERLFRSAGDTTMADFVAASGLPLRLIRHGKTAVISYRIVIPDTLKTMVVLDASYPIRKLEQSDLSLLNAETLPAVKQFQIKFEALKRFDRVTCYRMAHHGGRTSAVQDKTKMKRLMQDVVKVVKGIPEGEGVLIFVYKDRNNRNPKRVLESELESAGLEARTDIAIETWGNETSLNSHRHRQHVILVGILHRDLSELEAHLYGQLNDLTRMTPREDLRSLALSERVHCAYQALSRGSCRLIGEVGQATPMTGYIIESDERLEGELSKVMPGITWKTWKPTYADAVAHGKLMEGLADRIQTVLKTLPVCKISSRRLRTMCRAESVDRKTWQRSISKALDRTPQWRRIDSSLECAA